MFDYEMFKKILFKLDPEVAHSLAEFMLKNYKLFSFCINHFAKENFVNSPVLNQEVDGITYKNPVGLAAGFDKNATMFRSLMALGFGFVEIGTLTPYPQNGNAKPRLFRYPEFNSLQNAMGFNNEGMQKIYNRVKENYPFVIPIGINIGKNKTTPEDKAIDDYLKLTEKFSKVGDFFVINISSPNTPGLRDLQNENFLKELLPKMREITTKAIYLKIAPDMSYDNAFAIIENAISHQVSGIIINNTSIDYSLLPNAKNFGGISGEVIKEKSREFFKQIAKEFFKKTTLISVGGIDSAEEAYERIKLGASLVEVYTALVFKGINNQLVTHLRQDGFKNIKEAIGILN